MKHTKTLRVRVRDKHAPLLRQMARSVNLVWNYLNELSHRSIRERGVFLSAYDMDRYTKGANKELGLHSQTLQEVSREYATRRKQFGKARLNWRRSGSTRRSLGWIPFKSGAASWKHGQVYHNGRYFKVWDSHGPRPGDPLQDRQPAPGCPAQIQPAVGEPVRRNPGGATCRPRNS